MSNITKYYEYNLNIVPEPDIEKTYFNIYNKQINNHYHNELNNNNINLPVPLKYILILLDWILKKKIFHLKIINILICGIYF